MRSRLQPIFLTTYAIAIDRTEFALVNSTSTIHWGGSSTVSQLWTMDPGNVPCARSSAPIDRQRSTNGPVADAPTDGRRSTVECGQAREACRNQAQWTLYRSTIADRSVSFHRQSGQCTLLCFAALAPC